MRGSFKPLQTPIKNNIRSKTIPKVRGARNKGFAILSGAVVNCCELVWMHFSITTQSTRRHIWLWQFGVEGMASVVTDLVQHAERSNLATMLKVALYKTVA